MDEIKEYSLEFLPAALNDMTEIISAFIMLESKQGAVRIKTKMLKAADRIKLLPYSGITVPDKKLAESGFRMVVVEKYLMFYKIFEAESKVLFYRVLNGRTNYPEFMNKLYNDK